jgi:hypothetical protein
VNSGKFIQFIDQDGSLKPYAPTVTDVKQRDAWLQNKLESAADAQAFKQFALVWLTVLPLGLVVAFFWPGMRQMPRSGPKAP